MKDICRVPLIALVLTIWPGMQVAPARAATQATSQPPAAAMPAEEQRAALREIRRLILANYLDADLRPRLGAHLARLSVVARSRAEFAAAVTASLHEAVLDRHLWLAYDPPASQGLAQAHSSPAVTAANQHEIEEGRQRNQGYEDLRILDGNVRYVRISGFYWQRDMTAIVIDAAARFMKDGNAVIIDLRGNGGGDSSAVQYLLSHFVERGTSLGRFRNFRTGAEREDRALDYLPAGRIRGKPLFILIDGHTASAAESFAYHLRAAGLAQIVGETSAGAANTNTLFPVETGFVLSVSTGRPVNPLTGSNWERVGVQPHLPTPSAAAADRAHLQALTDLAGAAGDEAVRRTYAWAATIIQAKLEPLSLSPQQLEQYAGVFGSQQIRIEGGQLVYQREGRPPVVLRPLLADLFAFGDSRDTRIRFVRAESGVIALKAIYSDGETILVERSAR